MVTVTCTRANFQSRVSNTPKPANWGRVEMYVFAYLFVSHVMTTGRQTFHRLFFEAFTTLLRPSSETESLPRQWRVNGVKHSFYESASTCEHSCFVESLRHIGLGSNSPPHQAKIKSRLHATRLASLTSWPSSALAWKCTNRCGPNFRAASNWSKASSKPRTELMQKVSFAD